MTQVERPRLKTEVRWGRIYGWDICDHDAWMAGRHEPVENDYVGQTTQKGRARENQHRDSRPWADLTVGSPRVLWEGMCTAAELDEMERRFIQDVPLEQRPRMNWQLNEDNPRHIPKWVQEQQRHERDARRGDPPWQPVAYRPEAYGYRPGGQARTLPDKRGQSPRKPWSPRRKHLAGLACAWTVLTLAGVIWRALAGDLSWPMVGWLAAGAAALTVWTWLLFPLTGRQAKRRWKARLRTMGFARRRRVRR